MPLMRASSRLNIATDRTEKKKDQRRSTRGNYRNLLNRVKVTALAIKLEDASDFILLGKIGKINLSERDSEERNKFRINKDRISMNGTSEEQRQRSCMNVYAGRYATGEPFFRYPFDDLIDERGPQVMIKEYVAGATLYAEKEVLAYDRLLVDDRPEIVVDEYGRGQGQARQMVLPVVRLLAYFAAEASESGNNDGVSFYVAQEWVGLKRLSEYASAKQKDDGEKGTKFWPPVERVQTHPIILRFRYVRSAIRQTARAVAFCHANGVAHNGIDSGTFFCDSFDDRKAFEERGELGVRFRLANFGAAILDPTDEEMARDVRSLGKVWAEVIFSALAREGPSASTKADALTRQFETLFNLNFDGQIWEYLEADQNFDVARYFLREKFADCDDCVWDVLRDAWLCDPVDENYAVTAASLARRLEKIASEADRVARGEIERETQTIKVELPGFITKRLGKVAKTLDRTIVQDPSLPEVPKPDWYTGKGDYAKGVWSDRIGKDYREQIKNITPSFLKKFLDDDDDDDDNDDAV